MPTVGTLARRQRLRSLVEVSVTPTALRLLDRLRAEGGDVALIVAPHIGDGVICVGRRDFTLGPNDLLIATVRGCPLYVDRREPALARLPRMVLDVELDEAGPTFVFRPAPDGPA